MNSGNPEISQNLLHEIRNQKSEIIEVEGIKIKTCKDVFPPRSVFSSSSEKLHTIFGEVKDKLVLDVGTGTGVQAIHAAKDGAREVVALDISPLAVVCAQENVDLNNVSNRVTVLESDLFSALEKDKKYDIVIANLPIGDFPLEGVVEAALYDPGYVIHRRFFEKVGNYLAKDGIIIMSHANFKGQRNFDEFEEFLRNYGYQAEAYIESETIGYRFRMYRIKSLN